MIHREDIWKLITLIVLICVAISGNTIGLPHALQPFKEWFEFIAGVGAVVTAWHMKSPAQKE